MPELKIRIPGGIAGAVACGLPGANFADPASVHLSAHYPGTWAIGGTSAGFRGRFAPTADTGALCRPLTGSLNAGCATNLLQGRYEIALIFSTAP